MLHFARTIERCKPCQIVRQCRRRKPLKIAAPQCHWRRAAITACCAAATAAVLQVLKLELALEEEEEAAEELQGALSKAEGERDALQSERDTLVAERDQARAERDQARCEAAQAHSERLAGGIETPTAKLQPAGTLETTPACEGLLDGDDDAGWAEAPRAETLLPRIVELWEVWSLPAVMRACATQEPAHFTAHDPTCARIHRSRMAAPAQALSSPSVRLPVGLPSPSFCPCSARHLCSHHPGAARAAGLPLPLLHWLPLPGGLLL